METLIFREATKADATSVASLHTESWRNSYRGILPDSYLDGPIVRDRQDVWKHRLSSPSKQRQLVVLAMNREAPIGFVCVLLDEEPERGACLDNLHVASRYQGQGIGRHLLAKGAQWVTKVQPGWPMHLWVFEDNQVARRFYDSLDGTIVDREFKRIGGVDVPSLCYVWNDLDALVRRALGNHN